MNHQFALIAWWLGTILGVSTASSADPADTHPDLHLIPWPKAIERGDGYLQLSPTSRIVAEDKSLTPLADVLSQEIALITGLRLKAATGPAKSGDIVLRINKDLRADEPILMLRNRQPVRTTDGAHTVTVGEQVVVEGFDYRATAEGMSTVLQLIGQLKGEFRLPKVTIKDWPHADYCGVMLDVGRQDHPIEAIKKVVQICRLYKARYLQLHLTDDQGWTFPSTKYPQLGTKNYGAHGGIAPRVYKLDELKELVAWADARGVTLVPEFEMPGHSAAAVRSMPEVFDAINPQSKQPVGIGCMNISNEELYAVLDTLVGEMCDVFKSSPFFHIGSDEVTYGRLSLNPGYKAFMEKHSLKDDHELADHFVARACEIVKKHGKKAIKWEGLANFASKDVIIMCWDNNSTLATEALARGYTTITCPWTLAVPWEQWNMYRCNGSQLKKGDSVLGSTLVAWEQPPATHITNLRQLPLRQERTWGPDNSVTVEGFASRFQPLDAVAGKLLQMPPKVLQDATFSTSLATNDFLDPVFAGDGNDATFFKSATTPKSGDHLTLSFKEPKLVYGIEVLTGINNHGQLDGGDVQVSSDGKQFTTVAKLAEGTAKAILKDNQVQAVRLRAAVDQSEPLVVRSINLRMMVEVSGKVANPSVAIGEGNVAVTKGDAEFAYPIGACATPVINRDFTLKLNNGGNAYNYSGPISGTGKVELYAGGPNAPLVLDGKLPNTLQGTWIVRSGRVVLAKEPGVDGLGGTIFVGGQSEQDCLVWNAANQINDSAQITLLSSAKGSASLVLNGFSETVDRLEITDGGKVQTGNGGVLNVRELLLEDKGLSHGVYTSSSDWVQGSGYVVVGDVKRVEVAGNVEDPNKLIGNGNIGLLKGPSSFKLNDSIGSFAIVGDAPVTLQCTGDFARFSGFIAGKSPVRIEGNLELTGPQSSTYQENTTLVRGKLKLSKPAGAIAIPGNLNFGGSAAENNGDTVVLEADGQIAPSAVVRIDGTQPCILNLNGHATSFSRLVLAGAGEVRTGKGGTLRVKQLWHDGSRLKDGVYTSTEGFIGGTGKVIVDSRVDVQGVIGSPELAIGPGNIGNLTGNTKIGYPSSGGDYDIITNGFTLQLDSGDGNAFAYSGSISGDGNVEFFMGPSYTGYRDTPMPLNGSKPNTLIGKFLVKKGRVQLEKPAGVDAISGDVIVGGQGFNDCLFWKNSDQLKDSVNITLLDAGNNGAAHLHLNGCNESAASLTMTANNKVLTDTADGKSGTLTVKSLTIGGEKKPSGTYSAANERWIEGKGKVIVGP
jgi:hypothetical protein